MKPAAHESFGIAKRRGFWLRCFLGETTRFVPAMGILSAIAFTGAAPAVVGAQVDCVYRTVSVSRVQGSIFDSAGRPIPNVEVELKSDGKLIGSAETDEEGKFAIPAAPGKYDLTTNARGFAPGFSPIDVGGDLVRTLRPTHLWMILEVGMGQGCPLTTASRREFEKAIQKYQQKS